jgi:hypothetical protein
VKTNDYGSYDPTPTMAKPHFKDIPNWLTGHLHIWDRRLDVYCCYVRASTIKILTDGRVNDPTHIWETWYALHIYYFVLNKSRLMYINERHARETYIFVCMYVHLYFVDIYTSCAF